MIEASFNFMRVRGVRIGLHWSWLFVVALFTWSLGTEIYPSTHPGLATSAYMAMGLISALLFFASILLHELGHALRAQHEGMRIDGITLWLFGGVARFSDMFPSAGAELRIAVAGPAVSVVLASAFAGAGWIGHALGGPVPLVLVLQRLAWLNAVVAAFNLAPALPLDGGRILRAWLWHRRHSFASATASASRAGQGLAMALMALGILGLLNGSFTGAVWLVFLGWFLLRSAQAEARFVLVRQAFQRARVADLMTRDPLTCQAGQSVASFFAEVAGRKGHTAYPVLDGDRPVGLISLKMAGSVPPERREATTLAQVMLKGPGLVTLLPETPMLEAISEVRKGPGRVPVVEGGRLVGIISTSDIARALEVEEARGPHPGEEFAFRHRSAITPILVSVVVLGILYYYRPPVAVITPGPAVDISRDMTITGVATHRSSGRYLLTSVHVNQPSVIELILAMFGTSKEIVSLNRVIPRGVDPNKFFRVEQSTFRESRMLAAAAAAREAGMTVTTSGTGVRVTDILRGTPADGVLQTGDVVVSIDGQPVHVPPDLQHAISSKPAGTRFTLGIERSGKKTEATVASSHIHTQEQDLVGLGIALETRDFQVDLPFKITFRARDEIGGPSAGLSYALAITDMLEGDDLAKGRTIAATGTIDSAGRVGPIGGVGEKVVGARKAGAKLFLVPSEDASGARGFGLPVHPVDSLDGAVSELRAG